MFSKKNVSDLAAVGGAPVFDQIRSTSNLVRPDFGKFLEYSTIFYEQHRYTNGGPVAKLLEQRLAAFHRTRYCVSFCSGFWALVLTMKCLAVPDKTEIVMPSLTYRRMADLAAWVGLTPHFCEVDPATLGVTAEHAERSITEQTALLLGLERKGFEVRAHVYPPLRHRPPLAFKIRAGKPPKKSISPSG